MITKKKENSDYPKMGIKPEVRNPKLDKSNANYDAKLAKNRSKEKARRKANLKRIKREKGGK